MGFELEKVLSEPVRVIFMDQAGNIMSATAEGVEKAYRHGLRQKEAMGERFVDEPASMAELNFAQACIAREQLPLLER